MNVFLYSRISTDLQELTQQRQRVQDFLSHRGWKITKEVYDEDVSGYKVSYKNRGLAKLLDMMQEGDCLICSELSRLGRKMCDISKLINDDLKPRKLRLIIVSMGIDLDCLQMKAIDELIIQNFAFAAQVEVEMTRDRTKSSLNAIQKEIDEKGSHVSKKGNVITHLGRPKGCAVSDNAINASRESRKAKAKDNPNNLAFMRYLSLYERDNGTIDRHTDLTDFVNNLNALQYKTATGMDFDVNRARQMIYRVRQHYLLQK